MSKLDLIIVGAGGFGRELHAMLWDVFSPDDYRFKGFLADETNEKAEALGPFVGSPKDYEPTTSDRMPAISLAAVGGRRARTVELIKEIEDRGFSGIFCPSLGDAMSLCLSIAHHTSRLEFGTAVQPIYFQLPSALASTAAWSRPHSCASA